MPSCNKSERFANKFVIGLAGLGTVGSGLVEMLEENKQEIIARCGHEIVIKTVAVRDMSKLRKLPPGANLIDNPLQLALDPEIDAVVELIGGLDKAKAIIIEALKKGKNVVTANKALLAEDGSEIFHLAAKKKLTIGYEASVCGAIPIILGIKDSLAGNRIISIMGILNGTANFILSAMTSHGQDFTAALADAQRLGYAEADPTLDIDGFDSAHKLLLLMRVAWGRDFLYNALEVKGIRNIHRMDIEFAREFGYRIKLIGQARDVRGNIEAGVFPALVHHTLLLARVGGAYNAVRLAGNASGPLFLHGLGAGSRPTASAVLGDLIALARGCVYSNTGFNCDELPQASFLSSSDAVYPWYVRLMVRDTFGVLRDIAGAMANEQVSIAQVIQKKETPEGVPIVFMTHAIGACSIQAAMQQLAKSGQLLEPPVYYRALGQTEVEIEASSE